MAWEFRKLGPGENVAVEAQRDPFAAPKWAPPVWHMPEGLVLLVNLVRVIVRTVVFLVRNIVPVSVLSGLGWLGYRFGWTVPVVVLAPAVLGLSGWVLADRPSFVRWVGRPALARWRLVTVYRRNWQPVLVTAGLTKVHKGREYLPSLVRVRCGPTSDRVLVTMLKGQAPTPGRTSLPTSRTGSALPSSASESGTVRDVSGWSSSAAMPSPSPSLRCPSPTHPRWTCPGRRSDGKRTARPGGYACSGLTF